VTLNGANMHGLFGSVLNVMRLAAGALAAGTVSAFAQTAPGSGSAATPPSQPPLLGTGLLPRDLSPWGMFLNADIVVKVVMIGLVIASIATWTVWLVKTFEIWSAKRTLRAALGVLARAPSLAEAQSQLGGRRDAAARLVNAAAREVRDSPNSGAEALKECVAWRLERHELAAALQVGRGMGVLASIGATAPFVGLFGTVWGIMNSFIGISTAHTTNLAVVAPGIAEALLATALGLFAAIPAVVIYNVFARQIAAYRALLADAGALVMRLVSRDCEGAPLTLARAAE
jgi:biopolymer transport protein ExbB